MTSLPSSTSASTKANLLGKTPEATPLQTPAVSPKLGAKTNLTGVNEEPLPPLRSLNLGFPVKQGETQQQPEVQQTSPDGPIKGTF